MISDSSASEENIKSSVIGFLSHLTTDELKSILNDDAKLDEIMKDVKQGNDREGEKDMLLIMNRSLAAYNIQMEPALSSHKNDVVKFSEEGEELYNKVTESYKKLMSLVGQNKLEDKLSVLQLATAELEEESEKVADLFVKGRSSDVEDFLEQFVSRRKLMYLSKVKSDKLAEMIRHRGQMDSRMNYVNHNSPINMNGIPHVH